MTYTQVFKKLMLNFKNYIWNFKFYSFLIVWIISTIVWSTEPFFTSKAIFYIENFIKTWDLNKDVLIIFFVLWIIFIVLNSLIKYLYRYYFVELNNLDYYIDLSKRYKQNILYMSESEYLNKKWWTLYKILDRWLEWTFVIILIIFWDIFPSIISVVYITTILFIINYKMAFATMAVVPFLIFLWYHFNWKTSKLQTDINNKWDSFYGKIWDYLSNLTLVKTLTFEKNISRELDQIQTDSLALQIPLSKRWAIANIYVSFMINMARFIVLWTWIYLIKNNSLTFATLFLYFAYIWYLYFPLWFIFDHLRNLQKQLEWAKKLYTTFDNIEQDIELKNSKELKKVTWKIEFKDVSFAYTKEKEVLKNINFTIKPWEKIALVWDTGWWKSTVTKLLLRLFEIEKWEILIDDINIKDIKKSSLRKHIWIVMQDNTLFNTTILENLRFAKPNASLKEIENALEKSKASFVFKTEKWLNSIIWERWLKLSWWEKQRISIARIFLRNPEILILDEATSALDNKTETEIQKSINELLKWKTSIIIAHRLSTIKKVDKIFVIEHGKIVEMGSYEELMNADWKFYRLANPDKMMIN